MLDDRLLTSRTACAPDIVPPRTRRRGCSRHGAPRCPPRPGGSSPSPTPSASSRRSTATSSPAAISNGSSASREPGRRRSCRPSGPSSPATRERSPERQLLRQLRAPDTGRLPRRSDAPRAARHRAPPRRGSPGSAWPCRSRRSRARLASLPEGVVARDRIEVRFRGAQEAVARLFALAQALTNDYEQFEALVEGRGRAAAGER